MRLIVYHLRKDSAKSGWKVHELVKFDYRTLFGIWACAPPLSVFDRTCVPFFMLFQWKISEKNGTSEKVVLYFRAKCSKWKLWYHFQVFAAVNWFVHQGWLTPPLPPLRLQVQITCNTVPKCWWKRQQYGSGFSSVHPSRSSFLVALIKSLINRFESLWFSVYRRI